MKNQYLRWLVSLSIAAIFLPNKAFTLNHKSTKEANKSLTVTIRYNEGSPRDTLLFFIVNPFLSNPLMAPTPKIKAVMGKDSLYHFKLEHCPSVGYFQVVLLHTKDSVYFSHTETIGYEEVIPECYFEGGDNLFIHIIKHKKIPFYQNTPNERFTITYSGHGSDKLTILHKCLDSLETSWHQHKGIQPMIYDSVSGKFNITDRMIELENIYKFFKSRKSKFSSTAYINVQAGLIYYRAVAIINQMFGYYERKVVNRHPKFEKAFKDSVFKFLSHDPFEEKFHFPEASISDNDDYLGYAWRRIEIESAMDDRMSDSNEIYRRIITEYSGMMREKLIVYFFDMEPSFNSNVNNLFSDAEKRVKTPFYHRQLEYFKKVLIGDKAYNFTLPDTTGRMVSLKDFAGKVVVVDVWSTGCGGCELLYRNVLSKVEETFNGNKNVVFISISLDMKKDVWRKGRNSGLYTSPYAVNLYTNGLGYHHPFIKNAKVDFTPTTFIIDKRQNIRGFNSIEGTDFNKQHLTDSYNSVVAQITSLLKERQ